jgi:AraC-like DNA-binding protein
MNSSTGSLIADLVANRHIVFAIDNVAVKCFPPYFTFGPHAHRFIEIDYIEEGWCGMLFGTDYVRLDKGDCLLIFPEVSHYFFTPGSVSCTLTQVEFALDNFPWMSLPASGEGALGFLAEIRTHSRSYLKLLPQRRLSECMKRIREERLGAERGREEMIRLLFSQFFILLSREIALLFGHDTRRAATNPRVRTLLQILQNEYDGELSIEALAARCGVGSRYLRREFRSVMGMGIGDYILELRLRKARKLLAEDRATVLDIAMESGFSSSQYFARVFKKAVGMTPRDFRSFIGRARSDPLSRQGAEKYPTGMQSRTAP